MRRQLAASPTNCRPSPRGACENTSNSRKRTTICSPRVSTSPVISACALIACQSGYCTGLSKLVTWEI
jgi:hypothetical protein